MIYNQEVFEIEDLVVNLSEKLNSSQLVASYVNSFFEMDRNQEVDELKRDFLKAKSDFEKIEAYGNYAPDFKEKRRAVRKMKRQLDTNKLVGEFKYNETSFQNILDYMTFDIATSISNEIKIDAGNPFFEFAKQGCGGSCHVG